MAASGKVFKGFSLLIALIGAGIGVVSLLPVSALSTPAVSLFSPSDRDLARLVFAPQYDKPYLITRGGALLQPLNENWQPVDMTARVNDLYIEQSDQMWAGTDTGLLEYQQGQWLPVEGVAATRRLESTHGFLFALGDQGIWRRSEEASAPPVWKHLNIPELKQPISIEAGLVMLGNHSHVLFDGDLALTSDVGLSWKSFSEVPAGIRFIADDPGGNLLVVTDHDLRRWNYQSQTWSIIANLPNQTRIEDLTYLQDQLYALSDGLLYRLTPSDWQLVEFPAETGYYFTALQFHYPSTLWAADALRHTLWQTHDGITWQSVSYPILPVN